MTTEVENLVKYFSLGQLEYINIEYVDVMEKMKEILNLDIDYKVKWQLIVREVNHNNNYNFFNPDQVRELNDTGRTEHLDIVCGNYKSTGIEIIVTITDQKFYTDHVEEHLHFSQYFDINLKGEDYTFEENTITDLRNAIEELKKLKNNGVEVNGDVKSINTKTNNHSYNIVIDEDMATVSVYEIFESENDRLISRTFLDIR